MAKVGKRRWLLKLLYRSLKLHQRINKRYGVNSALMSSAEMRRTIHRVKGS